MKLKVCLLCAIGLIAATLCGCSGGHVARQLDAAEAAMEAHPDSALALLQAIDGSRLKGEPQARHALLLSQAYDKNYIDVTDDSLITIATNYYDLASDSYHRMLAHQYHAKVLSNAGYYELALEDALQALDIARARKDDFLNLSRIESNIANLFARAHNDAESLEWEVRALCHAKIINKTEWICNGYSNIGFILNSIDRPEEALSYADSAAAIAGEMDPYVCQIRYVGYYGISEFAKADSIFTLMRNMDIPISIQYHCIKDEIDRELGREPEGIGFNPANMPEPTSEVDRQSISFAVAKDRIANHDYPAALEAFNEIITASNNLVLELTAHKQLLKTQTNYANRKVVALKQQVRTQRLIMFLSIALIVTIIALIAITVRKKHKEALLKAQNKILLLSADYSDLQKSYNRETSRLNEEQLMSHTEIDNLNIRIQQSKSAGKKLFLQHFSWIEELGNLVLDSEKSDGKPINAVTTLKKRLHTVKSQEFLSQSIDTVNIHRNNILKRIKQECPQVAESEIEILALLCANLSPRIIGFILNIIPQSVYNAKSSIKRKLSADAPSLLAELSDVYPQQPQ